MPEHSVASAADIPAHRLKTIMVRLKGGLGNQMFQYAYSKALARKYGGRVRFDASTFKWSHVHEDYRLDELGLDLDFTGPTEGHLITLLRSPKLPGAIQKAICRMIGVDILRDDTPPAANAKTVLLEGYFQYPSAFLPLLETLRTDFVLPVEGEAATRYLDEIRNAISVAVHIRRGDYASVANFRQGLGLLTKDYFLACMDDMRGRVGAPKFFIFSNDLDWVRDQVIRDMPDAVAVDLGTEMKDTTEMALMRACRHFIISNSTFSWWPALLSDGVDKIVIGPRPWFREMPENLMVDGWVLHEAIWTD